MITIKRLGAIAATTLALSMGAGAAAAPATAAPMAAASYAPTVNVGRFTVDGLTYVRWVSNRWLGNPVNNKTCNGGGCSQQFQNGQILWTSGAGTKIVMGGIGAKYAANGGFNGWMRYPITDEIVTGVRGGVYQVFQNGVMFWSPASGPNTVSGGIRAYYAGHGPNERGFLGYPVSSEIGVKGGVRQDFQGGKVYWNASNGAMFATSSGDIKAYYEAKGAENSSLGLPTSEKTPWNGGYYQRFQGGVITWGPNIGSRMITTADFNTLAGNFGKYGWPTKDSWKDASGNHTQFQKSLLTTGAPAPVKPAPTPAPTKPAPVTPAPTTPAPTPAPTKPAPVTPAPTTPAPTPAPTKPAPTPVPTPPAPVTPVYPFTSAQVGATSVVLYGDSQLDGDSWSEQGARAMGFTEQSTHLAYGGLGYSSRNAWAGGTGWTAVQNKMIPFPGGTPGLVLVTLGGNDATTSQTDAQVIADSTALWAKLKEIYPKSKIVINGVMSRNDASHNQRRHIDAVLAANAKRLGVTYISLAGLASTANAQYQDNVHLSQAGHNTVAKLYIAKLAAALGR